MAENIYSINILSNLVNGNNFLYEDIYIIGNFYLFFILLNFLFKITAAPLHTWAQSIYENSPLTSATFISIVSKIVVLSLMSTMLYTTFFEMQAFWEFFFLVIGVFTIIVSVLGALGEVVLKRFYVYSSMTHVSFMLLALACFTLDSYVSFINYLIIYSLGASFIWYVLFEGPKYLTHLTNLKILQSSNPLLGFLYTLILFSMAGLPPLSGFFVKFDVLECITNNSYFFITFLILILTITTLFYYLRLVKILHFSINHTYIIRATNMVTNDLKYLSLSILFFILLFYFIYWNYVENFLIIKELTTNESWQLFTQK